MPTQTTQKNSGEKTRKAEWKRVKLRELTDYCSRGISPSYVEQDGYVVLNQKCIRSNKISFDVARETSKNKKISEEKFVRQYDVLINSTGVGTLGRLAQFKENQNNILVDSHVTILRSKKEYDGIEIHPIYFGYSLIENEAKIEQLGRGATGQTELSRDVLMDSIDVFLPEYKEQKKIAEVLSAYDDLIEVNQKKIKTLETLAQTLYKEWFVKPAKDGLPDGWEETALGNLCDLKKDKFIKKDHENLPLVDMARINSKSLSITNTGNSKELSTSRIIFQNGDILFGSIRCYLHKVALAPFNGVTNVSVFVVRPKEEYLKSFLYCHLFDADTLRWADQNSSGTKMPVIKWEVFKNKKIILPQKEKLSEFNNLVGDFFEQIKILSIENQNLQKTRDILIPQLVGGRIEVR